MTPAKQALLAEYQSLDTSALKPEHASRMMNILRASIEEADDNIETADELAMAIAKHSRKVRGDRRKLADAEEARQHILDVAQFLAW